LEVPEKPTYKIQKQKIGEFLSEMLAPEIYEILFSRDSEVQRNFVGDTTHVFSHIKQSLHVERFRVTPKNSEIFAIIEAGDANGGTGKKKKGGKVVINLEEEEEEGEGRKEEVAGKRRGRKKDEEDEDEGEEDEDEEDDKKRGRAEKSPRKQSLKKKSNLARAKTKSGSSEIPMKWVSEKEIKNLAISKGTKKCFALEPTKAGTTGKPKKTIKKSEPMKSVRRAGNNQSPKKKDLGKSQPKIDDMFKPEAKK
jgi:hypothetical protein